MTYFRRCAFLAFETSLRPDDMGVFTPQEMDALWDYAEAKFGA